MSSLQGNKRNSPLAFACRICDPFNSPATTIVHEQFRIGEFSFARRNDAKRMCAGGGLTAEENDDQPALGEACMARPAERDHCCKVVFSSLSHSSPRPHFYHDGQIPGSWDCNDYSRSSTVVVAESVRRRGHRTCVERNGMQQFIKLQNVRYACTTSGVGGGGEGLHFGEEETVQQGLQRYSILLFIMSLELMKWFSLLHGGIFSSAMS